MAEEKADNETLLQRARTLKQSMRKLRQEGLDNPHADAMRRAEELAANPLPQIELFIAWERIGTAVRGEVISGMPAEMPPHLINGGGGSRGEVKADMRWRMFQQFIEAKVNPADARKVAASIRFRDVDRRAAG